jgi:hypothetical protein
MQVARLLRSASPGVGQAGPAQRRGYEVPAVRPRLRAELGGTPTERASLTGVTGDASSPGIDRVIERRRAIERRWTPARVLGATLLWELRYGRLPSSYDWSGTHARRRGGEALRRLNERSWPSASVVTAVWGSRSAAAVRSVQLRAGPGWRPLPASHAKSTIGHRAHFCAQSPVIHRYIRGSDVAYGDRRNARFAGISGRPGLGARVIRLGEVLGSNPGARLI